MIKFRQKTFSVEYDAMRSLYVELMKRCNGDKRKWPVINSSALLPILKGNNVVIERFVISTPPFSREKYRMYLKVGARAKMPDEVRLPNYYRTKHLPISFNVKGGLGLKSFSKNRNRGGGGGNNNNNQGGGRFIETSIRSPEGFGIDMDVQEQLGETLKYDKRERSIVIEFPSIDNAIKALNILPFGIDYKIYLLDA